MTASTQETARQALTHLLAELRPDWDRPGIAAAVDQLHRDREPLGLIARAAIDAALTPSTKTPGGIAARIRDGFTGAAEPEKVTPTPPPLRTCTRCGAYVTEPDHEQDCARRASAETYTAGAAAARAALHAARKDTT